MKQKKMKAGDRYRHYKGSTYKIVAGRAFLETAPLTRQVVYQHEDTGIIWVRPYEEFTQQVKVGNNTFNRFTRID